MSTVKTKKVQLGTDATASNNFTLYQPATPDGTLRIGVGNADSPTEVGRFNNSGYVPAIVPTFQAYNASTQNFAANVWTKVIYDTELIDTNSNYDTSNSRFTPTVAGYYLITSRYGFQPHTTSYNISVLYKNGSAYQRGEMQNPNGNYGGCTGTWIVPMNGTTDYVEQWVIASAGFTTEASNTTLTWWSGTLLHRT